MFDVTEIKDGGLYVMTTDGRLSVDDTAKLAQVWTTHTQRKGITADVIVLPKDMEFEEMTDQHLYQVMDRLQKIIQQRAQKAGGAE